MAKIIPSGVIQLPDFAELQYRLDRQKKQDEMNVARELAQYKRQSGVIAPGAMPLVQGKFDEWQKKAEKYAADQSPESFAELNRAYDEYSQAHGYGKFLFDAVKERDAKFYSEPTKWGLKVDDYISDSNSLLNNPYTSLDELATATANISDLQPAKKYEFGSAEDFSNATIKSYDKVYKDLDIKGTGSIAPEQRDNYFNNIWQQQILSDDTSVMKAVLSEAKRANIFGEGAITDEDINRVMSNEDMRGELLDRFYQRAKSNFENNTRLAYEDRYDIEKDKRAEARARATASASAGGGDSTARSYKNLTAITPDQGTGFIYRIDNNPIKTADNSDIVAFGVVDGVETVVVIPPKNDFQLTPPAPTVRRATEADKSNMKAEIGTAYQGYISKGKPMSKKGDLNP
jgi:hypothetical protein